MTIARDVIDQMAAYGITRVPVRLLSLQGVSVLQSGRCNSRGKTPATDRGGTRSCRSTTVSFGSRMPADSGWTLLLP